MLLPIEKFVSTNEKLTVVLYYASNNMLFFALILETVYFLALACLVSMRLLNQLQLRASCNECYCIGVENDYYFYKRLLVWVEKVLRE